MSILCITPNPAQDRTLHVPDLRLGDVCRARSVRMACGGKGINVARTLTQLGCPPVCAGFLGGSTGRFVAAAAAAEGLDGRWTWIDGETRICLILLGDGGACRNADVVDQTAPVLRRGRRSRFVDHRRRAAAAVSLSGSAPPGTPAGSIVRLIAAAAGGGQREVWVDTSAAALVEAVAAAPFGIKINGDEAAAVLARPVTTVADAVAAAAAIRRHGATAAAVTLGAAGAVLALGDGVWFARPPAIGVVNAVGSGDCFLAGLLAARRSGLPPAETLRRATACGAGNAARAGVGLPPAGELARLVAETEVGHAAGSSGGGG